MSRPTPTLALATATLVAALATVFHVAGDVTATTQPIAQPIGGTTIDCTTAGEPVEFDHPSVRVGDAPVAWLTVGDGSLSTVVYELAESAGQLVVEVAAAHGSAADVLITRDGEPFVELADIPAGRQCLVDVEFGSGRYEWLVAGTDLAGSFGVPHRVDCSGSSVGDPWSTASAGLSVVVDVGDDVVGVASGQALVSGAATIVVHAVDATSDDAWVAIERDGDDFAVFDAVPPGGVCTLDAELPTGDYQISTDLHGNTVEFTVWPVAVRDLTRIDGGDAPVRLGLDEASAASYTDACDVFTADVVLAAVPADLEPASVSAVGASTPDDAWQVSCAWSVVLAGGGELIVDLTLPSAELDAPFDATRADAAAGPGFIDLAVIAEGCYATFHGEVATAACPYGTGAVTVSASVAGGEGRDHAGTVVSLLDNLWNRPAS